MEYGTIGSISHGTMREEDLIPNFVSELFSLASQNKNKQHLKLCQDIEARMLKDDYFGSDNASWDLNESLFDALNEYAPPYMYFGAHPGDGSDYGFWLSDSIEYDFDGFKCNDLSDVPDKYTGEVLHINDHGNISLYTALNGKLTEIWAVV